MRVAISLLLSTGLAMGSTNLWGATRHVPAEFPTIQGALDESATGDTVLVAPGVYTDAAVRDLGDAVDWTSCAFIPDGVVLKSSGGAAVTTILMDHAPGPQAQVVIGMDLASPETLVEGFTITTSLVERGAFLVGRLTFRGCVFRDGDAGPSTGGGIAANGDLTLIDCEFVNCQAHSGGAIYHANGRIEMYNCYVHECGSIAVFLNGNGSPPQESSHIEGCRFEDCWADDGTGALSIGLHSAGATVSSSRFVRNRGGAARGAVAITGVGAKLVEGCLFLENDAAGPNGIGGGLRISGSGTCSVFRNTFVGNRQTSTAGGSAVAFSSATGDIRLSNNVVVASQGSGGAIHAFDVALISDCNVFWDNPGGTGRYYTPSATDRVVDPLFCDPVAEDFRLMVGSPCLPKGSIGCGLIGAFDQGCGVISIERMGWGQIKAAYHGSERGK